MTGVTGTLEFGTAVPTALYRFHGETDRLLYVGVTDDLKSRMAAHEAQKTWWADVRRTTVEWYPTRQEALAAEATAIRAERPVHNIQHAASAPSGSRDAISARGRAEAAMALAMGMRMTALFLLSFAREIAETITSKAAEQAETYEKVAAELEAMIEPVLGKGPSLPGRYLEREQRRLQRATQGPRSARDELAVKRFAQQLHSGGGAA